MAIDILSVNPFVKMDLPESKSRNDAEPLTDKDFDRILTETLGNVNSGEISSNKNKAVDIAELIKLEMMRSSMALDGVDSESVQGGSDNRIKLILKYFDEYRMENTASNGAPESIDSGDFQGQPLTGTGLDSIIDKASRAYGVDPGLIRAVIKAESNFNPQAVSSAGAQGLMQLMPSTARGLGVTNSFDPEQNVMAGTKFLKQMLERYGGNLNAALAAYNWGPGNLEKKGGELPSETRAYMKKVKGYYAEYSA